MVHQSIRNVINIHVMIRCMDVSSNDSNDDDHKYHKHVAYDFYNSIKEIQ